MHLDKVYQSLTFQDNPKDDAVCVICNLRCNQTFAKFTMMRGEDMITVMAAQHQTESPEFTVGNCQHHFHQHCLFAWLLEEMWYWGETAGRCPECSQLKSYVKNN